MKYPVFATRDVLVGFGAPVVQQSESVAKRDFAFKVNERESLMGFKPSDFELYQIGDYEVESGTLTPCLPRYICSGGDVFGN